MEPMHRFVHLHEDTCAIHGKGLHQRGFGCIECLEERFYGHLKMLQEEALAAKDELTFQAIAYVRGDAEFGWEEFLAKDKELQQLQSRWSRQIEDLDRKQERLKDELHVEQRDNFQLRAKLATCEAELKSSQNENLTLSERVKELNQRLAQYEAKPAKRSRKAKQAMKTELENSVKEPLQPRVPQLVDIRELARGKDPKDYTGSDRMDWRNNT